MNFNTYFALFDEILAQNVNQSPYDNPTYVEYVKLNQSRIKRWNKMGELNPDLVNQLENLNERHKWIFISEPWCGDASHVISFIHKLSEKSTFINFEIQLRDSNSEINRYLTNGTKSIPIFIIRNEKDEDLYIWGPRSKPCEDLFQQLRKSNLSEEEQKIEIQNWYNQDKGVSLQLELLSFYKAL